MTKISNLGRRCDGFYEKPPGRDYGYACTGSLRVVREGSIDCDECGRVHQSFIEKEPPWSFASQKAPTGDPGFCSGHDMNNRKGNLTDFDVVKCNAGSMSLNPFLSVTVSGATDQYRCSYCHGEFEEKCIHGIY